ncbi:MAG: 23S rRNA (adenine(2503)-C(2))-methyltransferase RlmN [bacterium]|nr:23S rRNA (adenine(2503)-C(2))-methyltransferase RlmN [bacterium]
MDLLNLSDILNQYPNYRTKQIKKALFIDLIENWMNASTLPLDLRKKLNEACPLSINGEPFESSDKNTIKAIITLKDMIRIESVLMKSRDGRNTVCVSSQAGCMFNCSFCATGKLGFKRNLEVFEIIEQVIFFARLLKKENEKITNIVFMGMGEPFLNYDNLLNAIRLLNDKDGFNLGARHFSVSTVGIPEGIKKFANENLQVNLAISLHAPTDELRSKIIPINKKYPISEIISCVDDYILKTNRRVMFEYVMIKDLNDSNECAVKLADLMKKNLYFVNLISYNPTERTLQSSSGEKIKRFKEILEEEGITVTQRYRFGERLNAACGQLVYGEEKISNEA